MTYEEAKKMLKRHCGGCMHPQQIGWCKSHCEIGIAIEALEKQIPKKPIEDTEYIGWLIWRCPVCGTEVGRVLEPLQHHCECGQRIDWSEVE